MRARQNKGRKALATPAAQGNTSSYQSSANAGNAQAPRDAAAVFIGNAMRALRHAVAFRLRGAPPSKALHELKRARDAIDSAIWAVEYAIAEGGDA